MAANNPFAQIPYDVCNEYVLPAFPADQDCILYTQRTSQVKAVIILPIGAAKPANWRNLLGWGDVIANQDTTFGKARYITGIGSFLPVGRTEADLAGGRYVEITERNYLLDFTILNFAEGHRGFLRMVEGGWRDFDVWVETVGGRIIGGDSGMRPFTPDGDYRFGDGANSVEQMRLSLSFFFRALP